MVTARVDGYVQAIRDPYWSYVEGFWADTGKLTAAAADEQRGGAESAIIGFVDVHRLASVILTGISLWSTDNRLRDVAIELGISPG